jgi:hypothetical protein
MGSHPDHNFTSERDRVHFADRMRSASLVPRARSFRKTDLTIGRFRASECATNGKAQPRAEAGN